MTSIINYTMLFLICIFFPQLTNAVDKTEPAQTNVSLLNETRHSLVLAANYLLESQLPNGSWKDDPAITGLVLYSFLLSPSYNPDKKSDKALRKGFSYLEGFVRDDGGIYREGYRNYTTSVCLLAFTESKLPRYQATINKAKDFLIHFQLDESDNITRDSPFYGGIGYGGDERPDLSNTSLALEAIKAAEDYEKRFAALIPEDPQQMEKEEKELGLHWKKALVFLARCQNVKSVNDLPHAQDDGGFMYETGTYKEDRSHSYGSMTYAGVKSLLYARLDREDIRLKQAVKWINNHYTLDENPGFGTTSLYFYYMTFARCLDALGEPYITDKAGVKHNWRKDLLQKLVSLQQEEGFWINADGRYWENIKDLATAYSVIGIKIALKDIMNSPREK